MSTWSVSSEIGEMRNRLKHDPDNVDSEDVRSLLARAEDIISSVSVLKSFPARTFSYARTDEDSYNVSIVVQVPTEELKPLIAWLHDLEDQE